MNEDTVMPDWLHDIFLGYGDPAQAKYTNMPQDQLLQTIDFKVGHTTFSALHVRCAQLSWYPVAGFSAATQPFLA